MKKGYVLITGGTHGIGNACVRLLASEGYQPIFTGRDEEAGAALAADIPTATFIQSDLSAPGAARALADRTIDICGGQLAGLVNNAGRSARNAFEETTDDLCDQIFDLNLKVPSLITAYCLPALRVARGSVVMMSSIAGKTGEEGIALYTASKAGLIGLTKALALEIAPEVRVNAVCPGQIETRMMTKTLKLPGRRALLESRIPSGRLGQAEDIAEAVLWLISPRSSFVNGDVITVDGGETAGLRNPRSQ
ncbi:SDR family NAD(P)-dependent oxidoreductase [Phaeobacter inhibens]|uniref:SDR family NAD(P)-dependent oxidoreductase n=1 Tax=Phaeobacter inhibens TaxID=221822 RepID=UPI00076BB903|nr:SDR family oxidoreductase [Phaeobacter inhibens]KXF91621.1 short-chain dehydrogenase [Phaeobacter inhibens]WHP70644.1 SDR family oxidoreductase [Phaeobacter inhibens]